GPPVAAIAARGFAVHDAGSDGLLAPPVGGVDAGEVQEGEQGGAFVGQMLDEFPVGVMRLSLLEEQVETLADVNRGGLPFAFREAPGVERLGEQTGDPAGGAASPRD